MEERGKKCWTSSERFMYVQFTYCIQGDSICPTSTSNECIFESASFWAIAKIRNLPFILRHAQGTQIRRNDFVDTYFVSSSVKMQKLPFNNIFPYCCINMSFFHTTSVLHVIFQLKFRNWIRYMFFNTVKILKFLSFFENSRKFLKQFRNTYAFLSILTHTYVFDT